MRNPIFTLGCWFLFTLASLLLLPVPAHAQGSPTTLIYFNNTPPIAGVTPTGKGSIPPSSTGVYTLSVEVGNVNLLSGTVLTVWIDGYTYDPLTRISTSLPSKIVGTMTLSSGKAKFASPYTFGGYLSGVRLTAPDGTLVMSGIPVRKI